MPKGEKLKEIQKILTKWYKPETEHYLAASSDFSDLYLKARKEGREEILNRLYVDIYRMNGKTINKQSGFIHKHIILDMINYKLLSQLQSKGEE